MSWVVPKGKVLTITSITFKFKKPSRINRLFWYLYGRIYPKLPVSAMVALSYLPWDKWWAEKVWRHNLKVAGIA